MEITYEDAPSPFDETAKGFTLDNLIAQGLVAKVGFTSEPFRGEWMWVHVLEEEADGSLTGILLNTPFFVDGLAYGDVVQGFRRDHIYEAHVDSEVAMHSAAAQAAWN